MLTRIRKALILPVLSINGFEAKSVAQQKPVPQFESFQVSVPLPKRTTPVVIGRLESQTDAEFKQQIVSAAKGGPDFAGHYAVVGWSCGMVCINLVIVDVRTAKIYDTPFVGVGQCRIQHQELLSFRLDSRLL